MPLVFVGLLFYLSGVHTAASIKEVFPKRANYYLSWTIDNETAAELAQWDLLVLDAEVQERTPEALDRIRQLNPNVTILAYVTSQDIRQDGESLQVISPLRYKRWKNIKEQWYLKNGSGQRLSWWPGMDLVNTSTRAPLVGGKRYYDFLSEHVADDILSTGYWDGVFYDNAWEKISQFAGKDVDIDHNGGTDAVGVVDAAWEQGMKQLFTKTRARAKGKIVIVGNGDSGFPELNGVMYENFPKWGWKNMLGLYREFEENGTQPHASIVNANTNNVKNPEDYQTMRYGLTSSLMGDGFYSFDDGDQRHESTWWYDEYEAYLGASKGEPYRVDASFSNPIDAEGVWRRDFVHGTVLVNSGPASKRVDLDGEFEQIHGVQDKKANNGRITQSITVPAKDGRVLLRRIEKFLGASFDNGAFARVFNKDGVVERNGFFAYDPNVKGGNQVVFGDLEGDGSQELIVSDNTFVYVYEQGGALRTSFAPYSPTYNGGVTLSIGNVTGTGEKEIITGTRNGGGPHIRVFSGHGRLLSGGFFAFHPKFRGGVNVAVGDTNGNGLNEIIVGAGVGGGPHVQIYSADGRLLDPGFFPYDKSSRGGVRVASADINGDGIVEIVTGPGPGVGPLVKVFNQSGELVGDPFYAYNQSDISGIGVAAADLDGDGLDEIMALSADVFTASLLR